MTYLPPIRDDAWIASRLGSFNDLTEDPNSLNTEARLAHDMLVGDRILVAIENKIEGFGEVPPTASDVGTLEVLNAYLYESMSRASSTSLTHKGYLFGNLSSSPWLFF